MIEMCMVNTSETVDPNILFMMKDFHTVNDIVDRGPNNIWVTNGGSGVMIGEDPHGTYMGFGNNRFIEVANSPLLSLDEVDIEIHAGNIALPGSGYGPPLIDCRPTNTNGPYWIVGCFAQLPLRLEINYSLVTSTPIPLSVDFNKIKIRVRTTGYSISVNDEEVYQKEQAVHFRDQRIKLGRSAYRGSGVPDLSGRIYYFSISKPSAQG